MEPNNPPPILPDTNHPPKINRIWTKVIPITNLIYLVLSLPLVFGLDLMILLTSSKDKTNMFGFDALLPIWLLMLAIFGASLVFLALEQFYFRKKYVHSSSRVDGSLYALILTRNIIFLLNFVPVIQLGAVWLLFLGGVPHLTMYMLLLIKRRFKKHEN